MASRAATFDHGASMAADRTDCYGRSHPRPSSFFTRTASFDATRRPCEGGLHARRGDLLRGAAERSLPLNDPGAPARTTCCYLP